MHFLTARLSDKDISDLRRQIPRKDLVEAWRDIEDHAQRVGEAIDWEGSGDAFADMESAVVGAAGDDFVSGGDGAAADGGAED